MISLCYPRADTESLEKHIFRVFDTQATGTIGFRMFMLVVYALSRGTPEENLRQIFRLTDINDDGRVTKDELQLIVDDILLLSNEGKLTLANREQIVTKAFFEMAKNDGEGVTIEAA